MEFEKQLYQLITEQEHLLEETNRPAGKYNGIFQRYEHPVLTEAHVPLSWKFDLNKTSNPFLQQRFGINAVFNAGAIKWKDKYLMIARVEGFDRKSFFAIAESPNGIDRFRFWEQPITLPQTEKPDTNVYDMRLVQHEDGWIYGLFCTERKAMGVPDSDQSSAEAQCGLVRTKDLLHWERLPDLVTPSLQQRNVVLHPEFMNGKYLLYTRPQDGFIDAGGGIGYGFSDSMERAVITEEKLMDKKVYHTVYELKNGLGPAPIKTSKGWLHLAHGVRNTAAGFRYVLYLFLCSLEDPTHVTHKPAGYFMAPLEAERIGDVSNVLFSNGWILEDDGRVFIYYASSDTRMHVATSTIDRLIDYVLNTAGDGFYSSCSVETVKNLIKGNLQPML